jgi:Tfp pilus assembly protein PilF
MRPAAPVLGVIVVGIGVFAANSAAQDKPRSSVTAPTFSNDVAPIVFQYCSPCHREGGSAPFSLLRYEDVKARARLIADVTATRIMPPWKPEHGYGEFQDERRLSDEQIAVIQRWVQGGAIEGNAEQLPAWPAVSTPWRLGVPDLVLSIPTYRLQGGGGDVYRNFVIPIPPGSVRYIKAWEFLPGNQRVVHHATMHFDQTGQSRRLDGQDAEPGYEGLIPHGVRSPDGYFLDWGPGHSPYVAPDGMAWPLPSVGDLVLTLHLRPSGREETVRSSLGLYFSDSPPRRLPTIVRLTRQDLDIPPGEPRYVVSDSLTLDVGVDLYTIQPHAHYLARTITAKATLPDGSQRPLIYIRDWDFKWQGVYRYRQPLSLPSGTTIEMEWTYDNSSANPLNPFSSPRRISYGQQTSDEMSELWLQVVTHNEADRSRLARTIAERSLREEIVGHEKMLEADPLNTALHDETALLHVQVGDLTKATTHFEHALLLDPNSPQRHYNVGNALAMRRDWARAYDWFAMAISLNPDYSLALTELAWIIATVPDLRLQRSAEAVRLATHAVTVAGDRSTRALEVLAAAHASAGHYASAVRFAGEALALTDGDSAAVARLRHGLSRYRAALPYSHSELGIPKRVPD